MPHLVIDCSKDILKLKSPSEIMENVYNSAASSNLFELEDIKVRINPFQYYRIGSSNDNFIHVFANIMEGRSSSQKSLLSKEIIKNLKKLFPDVPILSINIRDFEKATYCNKTMV